MQKLKEFFNHCVEQFLVSAQYSGIIRPDEINTAHSIINESLQGIEFADIPGHAQVIGKRLEINKDFREMVENSKSFDDNVFDEKFTGTSGFEFDSIKKVLFHEILHLLQRGAGFEEIYRHESKFGPQLPPIFLGGGVDESVAQIGQEHIWLEYLRKIKGIEEAEIVQIEVKPGLFVPCAVASPDNQNPS